MSWLGNIFGGGPEGASAKAVKAFSSTVELVNALEPEIIALSDDALRAKTAEFKKRLGVGMTSAGAMESESESLERILPEAFAVVREAAKRTLGQRHFDVQLIGGMILNSGDIAEMRTGEGKTLVATLPAYLNALEGKGVHVVTVNDYLSRRDAVWMGQIYAALGMSVGVVNSDASYLYDSSRSKDAIEKEREQLGGFKVMHEFLRPCSRREAYAADITYGTNNEFGFDYLRDNIEYEERNLRQRDFHYAIVDEIDSILIDEARTPLIISAPTVESENLYAVFAKIADKLVPVPADSVLSKGVREDGDGGKSAGDSKSVGDYAVDEKFHTISLTEAGIEKAEKILGVDNIYTEKGIKYVHHLETAVRAKALYHKDKEYVVRDGQVIIVDEFTGRLQAGRRWSEGLHQAIEAKEGVAVQKESRTFASITFQNYFRLYKKLAGMTGTAYTSREEFFKVYGLDVVPVPTNKLVAREDLNDLIFQTEAGKFKAIAAKIKELNKIGQPVLIGTVSIEKNELLSEYLRREGIKHELLNAKPQHAEREGEIIAQAGRRGAVTISTNMAGRGVDIKLGGNPATSEQYEEVRSLGGLFVLGTERHEARRIDNQLRGRSGRQGDPGATQFFVSLDDKLMRVFASDMMGRMMGRLGIAEDQAIENRLITRSLESAQTKIEGFNFDARKQVLEYDDVLNLQRKTIYERRRKILLASAGASAGVVGVGVGTDAVVGAGADTEGFRVIADELEKALGFASMPMTPILPVRNSTDSNSDSADSDLPADLPAVEPNHVEQLKKIVEEKRAQLGDREFYAAVRRLFLQTIDTFWIDHLEIMDYMRSSVRLRAYGQRDPLVEYKKEGLRLFKDMESSIDAQIVKMLPTIGAGAFVAAEQQMKQTQRQMQFINDNAPGADVRSPNVGAAIAKSGNNSFIQHAQNTQALQKPVSSESKVGRNEPCPCGSGKKFKHCGLLNTEEHQKNSIRK
jgi:preprotein translocase subunit SecA